MNKSVLVIGAGITGVCSAEWLRRQGWDVTLIDRIEPGSSGQTSFGNAGLIARSAIIPVSTPGLMIKAPFMLLDRNAPLFLRRRYLPRLLPWLVPFFRNGSERRVAEIAAALAMLTTDAVDQHQSLASGTPAADFICTGEYVCLYRDKSGYEADPLANMLRQMHGFDASHIGRSELLERDPHLGPAYTFATIYKDYGWLSSPGGYVAALFRHFTANGGRYIQREVVDVAPGDRPVVHLQGGESINADKVVLSAGAWSGAIAKKLRTSVKLEAERGYHVSMYAPGFTAPNPYMITDAKFVLTPMDGFLRAAGITEFAGLNAPASSAPVSLLRRQMKKVYPDLEFEREEVWMGRRSTTPDSLPVLGETEKAPNVIHAYGGQHVGMTIGPRLGRMVADIALGRLSNADIAAYHPDRF